MNRLKKNKKLPDASLVASAFCNDRRKGREAGTGCEHLMNNGLETEQEQNADSVWTRETETTTTLIQGTHGEADRNREGSQQIKGTKSR